jgi:hypothetical protein
MRSKRNNLWHRICLTAGKEEQINPMTKMKTATHFFSLVIAMATISTAANVNAQGRGHHKGHEKRHHHQDRHWKGDNKDREHRHHHYERRNVHHVVHHHHRYCEHPPVVIVRRDPPRPRYVYYRDYDVYYDIHREVYVSYSGRNWRVSASLPVVLHRVDMRRAVRMDVDYYEDDFVAHLERARVRPGRIYAPY